MNHTLETERLFLRELNPEVYDHVFGTFSDAEIQHFFGFENLDDVAKEREKHALGMSTYNRSFVNFLMVEKRSGRVIGSVGFHTWYTQHARAEIGYAMHDEAAKGRGFMKEALAAVIRYGFEVMHLHRIEALVGPTNEASLALIRRFGFTREGYLREHYFKNGHVEDSVVFSLLKHEYRP